MPLTRYQLRNEYSLADPELYRAADKDDPEALLEGVAMAGLVGVLRQLGDLAEFAAEIFHNLHEDVMATAARGHGLSLRVQQLEAEFPLIEKAFLLQTNHSKFLHNSGVDWHPNLRLDQSLVTQGDLPRFVMDSYEECRGPPRLFLLDKFDMAGAGACLKRYTDPSFFKAEFTTSEAAKEELKREKKSRKAKKKGSRWKTGESPEETASHTKLHQLLLEDRYQSQSNVDTHHVKLKRRHSNNSLINSTTGKSYMERVLKSHSPDNKFVSRGFSISSRLNTGSSKVSGLDLEREIPESNVANELLTRDRRLLSSHRREERVDKPLLVDSSMDVFEDRNSNKLLELPEVELKSIPSTFPKVEDKKELVIEGKGDTEAIATEYHSDDANSEIENFTDALTTMDSELETDTEGKTKKERNFKISRKRAGSDTKRGNVRQAQFSDSQSILSEDGNDSFEKRRFSSSFSDTFSNSAENILSDGDHEANTLQPTVSKNVGISSEMTSVVSRARIIRSPDHAVSNGSCNDVSCGSDVGDSVSVVSTSSPRERSSEVQLLHSNSVITTSGDVDSKSESDGSAGNSLSRRTVVSDFSSQPRNDFPSLASKKSRTVEMFNSGNHGANEISMHLSDIVDPVLEVKHVNDIEETRPTVTADDSHCANQMNGKLDSPDSVLLNSETQIYGSAVEASRPDTRWSSECKPGALTTCDVKPDSTVTDSEEVAPSGETLDCLTSVVTCSETNDFMEKKNQKVIIEADSGESEVEGQICIIESNMSNYEMKDEQEPDRIHVNSLSIEGHNDIYHELPFTSTVSDTTNSASATDTPLPVVDSEITYIHSEGMEHPTVSTVDGEVNQEAGTSAVNIDKRSNTENEGDNHSEEVFSNVNHSDGMKELQQALQIAAEIKTSSTPANLPETGSLRESLESHPRENSLWTYQPNGESTSSPDPPSQPADSSFLSSTTHSEFGRSDPSVLLLQTTSQQSDLHNDFSNQHLSDVEPHKLESDISHPDNNDVQDNLEEVPPLPPLPPMQWRVGKLRHDHPTSMSEMIPPTFGSPASVLAETADWVAQQHIPNFHEDLAQPLNPFLQNAPSDSKNLRYGLQMLGNEGDVQQGSSDSGKDKLHHIGLNPFTPASDIDDFNTQSISSTSQQGMDQALHGEEVKPPHAFLDLGVTLQPQISTAPVTTEDMKHGNEMQTLKVQSKWQSNSPPFIPVVEYGKPMESLKSRLSRPRDPLIEAVASHDKSNLRKVTERVVPQTGTQVDERNSLLQQIRTKSFNLKPAVSTRPSIQGPKTNLKVVAILEKANAIRQALAGSDDDDDDNDSWSDS